MSSLPLFDEIFQLPVSSEDTSMWEDNANDRLFADLDDLASLLNTPSVPAPPTAGSSLSASETTNDVLNEFLTFNTSPTSAAPLSSGSPELAELESILSGGASATAQPQQTSPLVLLAPFTPPGLPTLSIFPPVTTTPFVPQLFVPVQPVNPPAPASAPAPKVVTTIPAKLPLLPVPRSSSISPTSPPGASLSSPGGKSSPPSSPQKRQRSQSPEATDNPEASQSGQTNGNAAGKKRKLSPAEKEEKARERIIRNRAAAQESREKKRRYLQDLETSNQILEKQNQQLTERLQLVEDQNRKLMSHLEELSAQMKQLRDVQTLQQQQQQQQQQPIQRLSELIQEVPAVDHVAKTRDEIHDVSIEDFFDLPDSPTASETGTDDSECSDDGDGFSTGDVTFQHFLDSFPAFAIALASSTSSSIAAAAGANTQQPSRVVAEYGRVGSVC
ncbi:hypothetical protein HK102_007401 [Quaeritorhiza haematococci]|nr:hypothetical protein HK102_007401 [Quaeritorhiza haematococci]